MTTFTVKKTKGTKIADIIDETKGCFVTNVRFNEDIAKKVRKLDK